jgi:23S rRNA (cytidine1920-2'-O)/16S rRNA (cytidine1409-2'-O)-methyltransferase
VKPQFEVGKGHVGKGGVVRDPHQQYQVLCDVLRAAQASGLGVQDGIVSPLLGAKGNREFLVHLRLGTQALPLVRLQELCARLAFAAS